VYVLEAIPAQWSYLKVLGSRLGYNSDLMAAVTLTVIK